VLLNPTSATSIDLNSNLLLSCSGKHYVTLVVMTPTNMTEKQAELLKQYHELENAKGKEEKSTWSKKISLDLDKAWSRLKSFAGQSQS
jgi:DnaJ-class molecular chaperone